MRKDRVNAGAAGIFRAIAASGRKLIGHMGDGWYMTGDPSSCDRLQLVRYNLTANIIANLIGGNFFTGLLLILQADDGFIGLNTILIYTANLLQLVSPFLMERLEKRKPVLIATRCCIHFFNIIAIGLIPFAPGGTQTRLALMAACVLIVNALSALTAPGFSVWHIAHIPPKVRVPYFSLVSSLNGIAVAAVNLAAAWAVDLFKADNFELYGLITLRVIALLIAVYDIVLLCRIRELPSGPARKKIVFKDFITKPFKEKIYLRTVAVVFVWSLIANIPGSYYTVYLLKNVGLSYSYITVVNFFNVPILLLTMPIWKRIFSHSSWFKPLALGMLLLAPHYIGLAFASDAMVFLYPLAAIWSFVCMTGVNLAFSSVAYVNIPKENQTLFISFYSTAANLGALVGVTFGRQFVTGMGERTISLLGILLCEKQLLMLVTGVLMLGVAASVYFIWKKNARDGVET